VPVDEAAQTAGEDAVAGEDLAETRSLDLTEAPATKRR
jgi:hypothetical protein